MTTSLARQPQHPSWLTPTSAVAGVLGAATVAGLGVLGFRNARRMVQQVKQSAPKGIADFSARQLNYAFDNSLTTTLQLPSDHPMLSKSDRWTHTVARRAPWVLPLWIGARRAAVRTGTNAIATAVQNGARTDVAKQKALEQLQANGHVLPKPNLPPPLPNSSSILDDINAARELNPLHHLFKGRPWYEELLRKERRFIENNTPSVGPRNNDTTQVR